MFHCTVAELGRRLSSLELSEWEAEFRIEAWGEQRADLAAAQTTAAIVNTHGGKSSPLDFMLYGEKPDERATNEDAQAALTAALRSVGVGFSGDPGKPHS